MAHCSPSIKSKRYSYFKPKFRDFNAHFQFVEDHFEEEGQELEPWVPEDWTPEPEFIANLRKPALRNLAKRIARLWRDLSRKIKDDVKDHPSLYSIIYVPNGFVVPGGKTSIKAQRAINKLNCSIRSKSFVLISVIKTKQTNERTFSVFCEVKRNFLYGRVCVFQVARLNLLMPLTICFLF